MIYHDLSLVLGFGYANSSDLPVICQWSYVILRNHRRCFCDFKMSQLYTENGHLSVIIKTGYFNGMIHPINIHVYGVSSVLITGITWAINVWYFSWLGEFIKFIGFFQGQTINKNAGFLIFISRWNILPCGSHGTSLRLHVPCNVDNARGTWNGHWEQGRSLEPRSVTKGGLDTSTFSTHTLHVGNMCQDSAPKSHKNHPNVGKYWILWEHMVYR